MSRLLTLARAAVVGSIRADAGEVAELGALVEENWRHESRPKCPECNHFSLSSWETKCGPCQFAASRERAVATKDGVGT